MGFSDTGRNILGFYSIEFISWAPLSDVTEISVIPTRPAKGPGWILVTTSSLNGAWNNGAAFDTVGYSEPLHDWMRASAEAFAHLTGLPIKRYRPGADC